MSKRINETFTKAEIKLLKRIAKLSVDIVMSARGTLPTLHFRNIEKHLAAAEEQNIFGDGTTISDQNRMSMYHQIIEEKVLSHPSFDCNRDHKTGLVQGAIIFQDLVTEIADLRDVIDKESGIHSAKKFIGNPVFLYGWTSIELLAYAFNNGLPRCPEILGVILGFTHTRGTQDGSCVDFFGYELATKMFEIASPEGLKLAGLPIQKPNKTLTLYRGSSGDIPHDMSAKMSWTLDIETAVKWSSKLGDDIPYVISTTAQSDEVLATFEHESEVVVPSNPSREIQIIHVFPPKKTTVLVGSEA